MLNSDAAAGTVVFGIGPDGAICGLEGSADAAQRKLADKARKFYPSAAPTIEAVEIEGRRCIIAGASRHRAVPLFEYDGRAYLREGSSTRVLNSDERSAILRRRSRDSHNGPWTCDSCHSFVGMLVSIKITPLGPKKTYRCSCGGEYWPA